MMSLSLFAPIEALIEETLIMISRGCSKIKHSEMSIVLCLDRQTQLLIYFMQNY